jgi:hypothetical protein
LKQGSLIFTGSLLRDIGKVVLDQFINPAISKIMDRVTDQSITFAEAERQVLGFDHVQVGAMVAKTGIFRTRFNASSDITIARWKRKAVFWKHP